MKSTYEKYSEFHRLNKITNQFFVNILVSYRAATCTGITVSHGGYPSDLYETLSSPCLALCSYKR